MIYFVTCKQCQAQYVGSTREAMHRRHGGHRTEIQEKSSPLGRHFARCGLENFGLQIIDCVKEGEMEALLIIEGKWQHKLATFQTHGNINSRDEMK